MTTRIRDIIDRPQPRSWEQKMCGVWAGECPIAQWSQFTPDPEDADAPDQVLSLVRNHADFIATFDPEHVALMESVIEAAQLRRRAMPHLPSDQITDALNAVEAYRREHGRV